VNIDRGQFVGRRLEKCPIVVRLHELAPLGGRAASRRDGRWFERFAEVSKDNDGQIVIYTGFRQTQDGGLEGVTT
jgi:hypothetical protein